MPRLARGQRVRHASIRQGCGSLLGSYGCSMSSGPSGTNGLPYTRLGKCPPFERRRWTLTYKSTNSVRRLMITRAWGTLDEAIEWVTS